MYLGKAYFHSIKYSQLLPFGHPAIMDAHYYGQYPDPQQKL